MPDRASFRQAADGASSPRRPGPAPSRDPLADGSWQRPYFLFFSFFPSFPFFFPLSFSFPAFPPMSAKARFLPMGVLAYQS